MPTDVLEKQSRSDENAVDQNAAETKNDGVILPYAADGIYEIEDVGELPKKPLYSFIKRAFDLVVSFLLLAVLIIPMLIVGALVMLTSPGPALYFQERLGLDGKPFRMIKFRTMVKDAEKNGAQWSRGKEDTRITRFGTKLRKSRIDELPQLWCIFIGKMSFVGPRPERKVFYDEFEKYIHGFHQRLKVKPGLTGYAQVHGGYDIRPEEKIVLDVEYMKNRSLKMDLKVLFDTVAVVITHNGAK